MKRLLITLIASVVSFEAVAGIRIFTCEPEWASLAKEIAGDKATIHSATTGLQDPHWVTARPSLIAKMRRAELVVCTGAGLEAGWLPLLQRKAGNPDVLPGKPGFLEVSALINMKEIPARIDRSEGDVHPEGNPHIHTDPHNISIAAKELVARLKQIDAGNAQHYQQQYDEFIVRWQAAISRWQNEAETLRGMPVITQHKSWIYLIEWLGLDRVAVLEEKAGIPPSAGYLASIASKQEAQPAKVIIRAAYQSPRASQWLAEQANIPAVALPYTVGGNDTATDLFSLFDETLRILKSYVVDKH